MQDRGCEYWRTPLPGTSVKIALAATPFSWFRGGTARAMGHLGEYSENLLRVHRRFIAIRYNANLECLGKVER